MTPHTWASRGAAAAMVGLAALQLARAGVGPAAPHPDASAVAFGCATLLAAIALWRVSCFETRLVAAATVGAQLGALALAGTVGLPGGPREDFAPLVGEALLLPTAALWLLAVDRRLRQLSSSASRLPAVPSPYAR
ncbi:hypothetical protein [Nocardioides sp. SYSU DS0651]|uniref:hypothetical protein n=1 Tax=Nocardioides sp. SYSU DS0651 TaxID=3415955 RepID=UPI003F4C0704